MNEAKYLVIGGGVAGTTAAETLRQSDQEGRIVIVSDEPYRFYSRIMLSKPNFFLEKIPFDQIWLKTENWYPDNRIEFLGGRKAVQLDTAQKVVTLDDGNVWRYQKLLLATGAGARRWDVPGAEKEGVFALRTLDDAKGIIAQVKQTKEAVLIGSGFVSFEMADMLRLAGVAVTLVILESYYWEPVLDETSGRMIEKVLQGHGVKINHRAEVAEVLGEEAVTGVRLKDGRQLPCQLIIAGIGAVCATDLAQAAGIKVNRGILANEYLETSAPDVWTAGDCAEFHDLILGEQIVLGNWVNAQFQGKIAALNMTGRREPFKLVSFYTTSGFGITIAFVGDGRASGGREVVLRGSPQENAYGRLIFQGGKLLGATLINLAREIGSVSKLIEAGQDLSARKSALANLQTDLATLIPANG